MGYCQANSNFWQFNTTDTFALHSPKSDYRLSLCENVTEQSTVTNYSWQNPSTDRIPLLSTVLIVFGAFELIQQRVDSKRFLKKSNKDYDSSRSPFLLYFLIISQLLLATTFPTAWYIPYYSSRSHLIWSTVQFFFWTVMIMLSYNGRKSSKMAVDKWSWKNWRIAVFCSINSLERLLWMYNSASDNNFNISLFILESIFAVVVVALDFKIRQSVKIKEQDTESISKNNSDAKTDEKPPRSLSSTIRLLLPYLWPKSEWTLQLRVAIVFGAIVLGRITSIYVPLINKQIVDSLTPSASGVRIFRWDLILVHAVLFIMEHSVLETVHRVLWTSIEQFTSREAQVRLYEKLLNLSLRFHIGRKTGEVLRVMDRGTSSVTQVLNYSLFEIIPTFADIIIGTIFLTKTFDLRFTLITINTIILYLATIAVAHKWRSTLRKEMNKAEDAFRAIGVDSLLNYETVKYCNAEEYETSRYRSALVKSHESDWLWTASVHGMNSVERFIVRGGLLAGALLCAFLISREEDGLTVGDYVLFASYMQQLINPLNFLQYLFRYFQKASIDIERMFDIMDEKPEVSDRPDAANFECKAGKIEFRNVSFRFKPEEPVLSNLNFVVEPGKTLAIVGHSGAGKSTVIRLLFRFYDVASGQVLFDDQNVTTVTQQSLRRYMGVVPQDTVLFNDSIRFNIRYGRVDATDDEVEAAAKAADIHDAILGFSEGYDTKVGERGLKLSGGEKQRIAIARTILKSPTFVFLDEATSALDTNTERNIQASLQQICSGRTTVVIAHRLSTIIGADEIIVLQKGSIAERGTHRDLLEQKGLYHDMWMEQLSPEKNETPSATYESK